MRDINDIDKSIEFIEFGIKILNTKEIKLFPFQTKILYKLLKEDKIIILKARQMGITNIFTLYALYKIINNDSYSACIVFSNHSVIKMWKKNLIEILREFGLTDISKPTDNKIILKNNSYIHMLSARSLDVKDVKSYDFTYVDECAFYPSLNDVRTEYYDALAYTSTPAVIHPQHFYSDIQNIPTSENLIISSTAGKVGSDFHKLWKANKNGLGDFYPIKLPWDINPTRDSSWLERQKTCMGKKMVNAELKCKFIKDKK